MKYLLKNANLTGITKFLNDNFSKKDSNERFNPRDVLGYINRGKLPEYLGGNKIIKVEQQNCSVKLYNIQNNENEL